MSDQRPGRKELLYQLSDGAATLGVLYVELIGEFNTLDSDVNTRSIQSKRGSWQATADIINTLAKLARRGRYLHVGGKCPCSRECSTFALRRRDQCTFEDASQSGLDVLDCMYRALTKKKGISDRLVFKLDALSDQKQKVAEFVKALSASIATIETANKTETTAPMQQLQTRKRHQAVSDGAVSSPTVQDGAESFVGEQDDEEEEDVQQSRKGKKSQKRVVITSDDDY